jgi:hypothetical protein
LAHERSKYYPELGARIDRGGSHGTGTDAADLHRQGIGCPARLPQGPEKACLCRGNRATRSLHENAGRRTCARCRSGSQPHRRPRGTPHHHGRGGAPCLRSGGSRPPDKCQGRIGHGTLGPASEGVSQPEPHRPRTA